jgi:hypothetical protein
MQGDYYLTTIPMLIPMTIRKSPEMRVALKIKMRARELRLETTMMKISH